MFYTMLPTKGSMFSLTGWCGRGTPWPGNAGENPGQSSIHSTWGVDDEGHLHNNINYYHPNGSLTFFCFYFFKKCFHFFSIHFQVHDQGQCCPSVYKIFHYFILKDIKFFIYLNCHVFLIFSTHMKHHNNSDNVISWIII